MTLRNQSDMPQMIPLPKSQTLKTDGLVFLERQAKPHLCAAGPEALSPYLRLLHRGCVLVAHGAYLHSTFPFSVTLLEELSHDAISPLSVQLQGLGGIAEVRTVYHVPEDLESTGRDGPSEARQNPSLWASGLSSLCPFYETGSPVAQIGLELAM